MRIGRAQLGGAQHAAGVAWRGGAVAGEREMNDRIAALRCRCAPGEIGTGSTAREANILCCHFHAKGGTMRKSGDELKPGRERSGWRQFRRRRASARNGTSVS